MPDDAKAPPPGPPGDAAPQPPAPATPPPKPAVAAKPDPLKEPVPSRAVDRLREAFADSVLEVAYHARQAAARVPVARLLEILAFLRDEPELRFDYLSNVTAVHWPKRDKPLELVYHLYSIPKRHRLTLKVDLAEGEEPPTASALWPAANWQEREVFDLFGIRFAGHPDMTRILMPDEWVGHPLRKDYPLEGHPRDHVQYREVTTAEHVYRYDRAAIRGFGWKKEIEKTGQGHG